MTSGPKRVGPGGAPRRTKINIRELDVRERSAVGIFPGIKFSQRSIRNLSRFQDTQLHGLYNMVDRLVAGNIPVAGIIVNTSENFPIFSSLDEYQSHVTVDILRCFLNRKAAKCYRFKQVIREFVASTLGFAQGSNPAWRHFKTGRNSSG